MILTKILPYIGEGDLNKVKGEEYNNNREDFISPVLQLFYNCSSIVLLSRIEE